MKRIWSGLLAAALAGTAYAQEPILQPKLVELQDAEFNVPLCPLKPQNKTLEKGIDALKKSFDKKADKAAKAAEAKDLIIQSITADGQAQNAAAWYYLARVYLQQGDVGGVDSAFAKAQQLEPKCEIDINQYRQNNWAKLANAGLELQKQGDVEGAITLFRDAHRLFQGMPHVASNLGVLFANASKDDSAAAYFKLAYEIAEKGAATDTSMVADRNANAMNLVLMYQRLNRHKESIPVLQKYLTWDPNNMDARKMLIDSYRGAGMADSADALSNAVVSEMSKQNLDSLDVQDVMAIGVAAFNAQKYPEAASAFAKAMARNPYSRDAVYNLANAYLAMNDHQKLVETAAKLVEIEPMNEDVYRLLGQGHKGLKHDDEVLKAAENLVGLPVAIEMGAFSLGKSNAKLQGTATGRSPTDAQGKAIKPTAVTLSIEFVTSGGQVVDTKEVEIPILEPGKTHPFSVDAKGENIAGWRYKRK